MIRKHGILRKLGKPEIFGFLKVRRSESQSIQSSPKRRGFTLVELLLAMGILTLLMVVIMRVFLSVIEMKLQAEADSAVSQDSAYIFSRLTYDINRAAAIVTPASAGASGSSLTLTIDGTPYTYTVDGTGQLVRQGGGTVSLTGSGTRVTSASFTRRGGATGEHSITFDITLDSRTQRVDGTSQRRIMSTVGAR